MRDILRRIGPSLRSAGFRGSGQTFRKSSESFVFVVNFQGSSSGESFYVNLGAQPTFIPAEGHAELTTLKEYECVFRTRVGSLWHWAMTEEEAQLLDRTIQDAQGRFFGHVQTLREVIASEQADTLIDSFVFGTTRARGTLHLARAALALGERLKARELATIGMDLAGGAIGLRADLREVLEACA